MTRIQISDSPDNNATPIFCIDCIIMKTLL